MFYCRLLNGILSLCRECLQCDSRGPGEIFQHLQTLHQKLGQYKIVISFNAKETIDFLIAKHQLKLWENKLEFWIRKNWKSYTYRFFLIFTRLLLFDICDGTIMFLSYSVPKKVQAMQQKCENKKLCIISPSMVGQFWYSKLSFLWQEMGNNGTGEGIIYEV